MLPTVLRKSGLLVVLLILLGACQCGPAPTSHEALTGNIPWRVPAFKATFDQSCFCTTYTANVDFTADREFQIQYTFDLSLVLVDPAGAADPSDPGSTAALDPPCNNSANPSPVKVTAGSPSDLEPSLLLARTQPHPGGPGQTALGSYVQDATQGVGNGLLEFVWYHPSPDVAPPGFKVGDFSCDHLKQGPRGHQGQVTLTLTGQGQTCIAKMDGTLTASSTDAGQPGAPTCSASK